MDYLVNTNPRGWVFKVIVNMVSLQMFKDLENFLKDQDSLYLLLFI